MAAREEIEVRGKEAVLLEIVEGGVVVEMLLRSRERDPLILSLLALTQMSPSPALTLQLKRPPSHIHQWPSATTTIIVNDSSECFDKTDTSEKQQKEMLLFSAVCSLCCVRMSKCCPLRRMKGTVCGSSLGTSKARKAIKCVYTVQKKCYLSSKAAY